MGAFFELSDPYRMSIVEPRPIGIYKDSGRVPIVDPRFGGYLQGGRELLFTITGVNIPSFLIIIKHLMFDNSNGFKDRVEISQRFPDIPQDDRIQVINKYNRMIPVYVFPTRTTPQGTIDWSRRNDGFHVLDLAVETYKYSLLNHLTGEMSVRYGEMYRQAYK